MKLEEVNLKTKEAVDYLVQSLESGQSAVLTQYLGAMAKFRNYSFGNILLIARQKPDATHVAGYRTWTALGRFVRRGEKGIFILAPMVGNKRNKEESAEQNTDAKETQRTLYGFRGVYVFDRLSRDLRPEPLRARRIPPVDVLLGSGQRCTHHRSTPRSCATLADPGGP
jgi:hypothetical protein